MAKAHTLVDNFNDNTQDTAKWIGTLSERLREVNGRVEFRLTPNAAQAFHNYHSVSTFDLTESEFRVELVRAPFGASGAAAYLQARIDNDYRVQIQIVSGYLNCDLFVAGAQTKLARIPYDR
jgi:hypothetical protein